MLSLDDLVTLYPDQTWLPLSPTESDLAERQLATVSYSNHGAQERAWLNTLCLHTILNWLVEEPQSLGQPTAWLPFEQQTIFWEFVNGFCVTLGNTRLVFVPTQTDNLAELNVEQEWVDSPAWAAHYYVAIQVDPEESWLRILGYTTHDQLQQPENYDEGDHTYSVSQENLIQDLNVLWVARGLSPNWQPQVEPLPELSPSAAQALIAQLSSSPYDFPRLDAPFEQWAALIANPFWRQRLYQQQLELSQPRSTPINLSQWFQNLFPPGWQAVAYARGHEVEQPQVVDQMKPIVLGDLTVYLIVACEPLSDPTISSSQMLKVSIRIKPTKGEQLPADLQLSLSFNDSGDLYEQEILPNADFVEIPSLKGGVGNSFSVLLALGEARVCEDFII